MAIIPLDANHGFLLTSNCFDRNNKMCIELWLATPVGSTQLVFENEKAIFFVTEEQLVLTQQLLQVMQSQYYCSPVNLKNFSHSKVIALYFSNLKSYYFAKRLLDEANIEVFEGHIRPVERLLMERFVYGSMIFSGIEKHTNSARNFHQCKIKPGDYVPRLSMLSLDIECSITGELYCIGLMMRHATQPVNQVIMIGDASAVDGKQDFIEWVDNEASLLKSLERAIQACDPDIIVGWNVINFDFRLLLKRAQHHQLTLKLGRNASVARWRDNRSENNQGFISLDGRVVIDGIAALKAESYNFPSFSLESIAQHFLGEGKIVESENTKLDEITHNFYHNKLQLAHYNLQDCRLVLDIFEKAKLLDFLIFRSQLTGLELDRVGGSVAAFNNLYLPKLHRNAYVSPNLPDSGGLTSPGGYVMDSKPGLYQNIIVLDFKSLYPSIIRTFKIDPLGLVEGLNEPNNAIPGYHGALFAREKHLLPQIITELWAQRDQAKREHDPARSLAIKILMNSFYGVLGSSGCPFYDPRLASSITLRGHWIMQQTAGWIESQNYSVIYGDTDSLFVWLGDDITPSDASQVGLNLQAQINRQWQDKLQQEFQLESALEIEFECHFTQFLMPTIRGSETGSKKRYAGVRIDHGQSTLIFKGLENVRNDWTQLAKKFQQELYQLIFTQQEPIDLVKKIVSETLAGQHDADLIYTKRLRRKLSSYTKNVPPHVKAARFADAQNEKLNRPLVYQHKGSIAYVITLQGPQAVEYQTAPIDYQHYIDKQIAPIADGILPFVGLSFDAIMQTQLGLF